MSVSIRRIPLEKFPFFQAEEPTGGKTRGGSCGCWQEKLGREARDGLWSCLGKQEKNPIFQGIQPLATPSLVVAWKNGIRDPKIMGIAAPQLQTAPMGTTGMREFPKLGFSSNFLRILRNTELPALIPRHQPFHRMSNSNGKNSQSWWKTGLGAMERETLTPQNSMEWESQVQGMGGFSKSGKGWIPEFQENPLH